MGREDRPGEFDLIATYLRPLRAVEGTFDLLDDAACLQVPDGQDLVITKDVLASNVHFFSNDPPDLIAKKALRANVSDLIAKGATPWRYFLGLSFSSPPSASFMEGFCEGLRQDQQAYSIFLAGGDTTRCEAGFMLSVTALGTLPSGAMVRRDQAKSGDSLYVAGNLGNSALGLEVHKDPLKFRDCREDDLAALIGSYLLPEPPLKAAEIIRAFANAAMDISDGIFADLKHICEASDVSATLYKDRLPFSEEARRVLKRYPDLAALAYQGGDDYQPLICVSPQNEDKMALRFEEEGLVLTRIGMITAKRDEPITVLHDDDNDKTVLDGYRHF